MEKIFITWDVVSHGVVSLPSSKQREPGSKFKLDMVLPLQKVAGGDVANFISIVDILGSCWKDSLRKEREMLDDRDSCLYLKKEITCGLLCYCMLECRVHHQRKIKCSNFAEQFSALVGNLQQNQ